MFYLLLFPCKANENTRPKIIENRDTLKNVNNKESENNYEEKINETDFNKHIENFPFIRNTEHKFIILTDFARSNSPTKKERHRHKQISIETKTKTKIYRQFTKKPPPPTQSLTAKATATRSALPTPFPTMSLMPTSSQTQPEVIFNGVVHVKKAKRVPQPTMSPFPTKSPKPTPVIEKEEEEEDLDDIVSEDDSISNIVIFSPKITTRPPSMEEIKKDDFLYDTKTSFIIGFIGFIIGVIWAYSTLAISRKPEKKLRNIPKIFKLHEIDLEEVEEEVDIRPRAY